MDTAVGLWATFRDLFTDTDLVIPATQMLLYVAVINLLMLAGAYKACFLVSLAFSYYWLFFLNQKLFLASTGILSLYLGGGLVFLIFALVSFLRSND